MNFSIVVKAQDIKNFQIEGSKIVYGSLSGPLDGKNLEPLLIELPPHYKGPPPFAHEGEEFGYILEGSLTLLIQNEEYRLEPGDSAHFVSTVPHTWANNGSKPVKAIWVVTPRIIGGGHEP